MGSYVIEYEDLDEGSFQVFLMHSALSHAPMMLGVEHRFAVETLRNSGNATANGLHFVIDDKEFIVVINEVLERVARIPDA